MTSNIILLMTIDKAKKEGRSLCYVSSFVYEEVKYILKNNRYGDVLVLTKD